MFNPNLDATGASFSNDDKQVEKALRPKDLTQFKGQKKVVDNLKIFIEAAKL
ncbi:MAG TPA: Holliday junction branch migration DNA helicase RuvB, partial [Bacteroidetes bacterium]|nr:Holliday junction branch migration DNA helicase RuvB [Bacteroidota bacterium]